jgi:transposase-like protein
VARYGQKFKERVVARLLPPESSPVEVVSQTVGISVTTLERWRLRFWPNLQVKRRGTGFQRRGWKP